MAYSPLTDTTAFILQPSALRNLDTPLDRSLLACLAEKNIKLQLNVFDSHPDDTSMPVLVLMHGNSSSMRIFSEQIRYFRKSFRIIAIDLLGHGHSTKLGSLEKLSPHERNSLCAALYHPLAMMSEVTQCLETKKIRQATIIGWSLGGHIAYGIAAANPDLVRSIITIGAPPVRFSQDGFAHGFSEWFLNTLIPSWIQAPKHFTMDEARINAQHIGFHDNHDIQIFTQDAVASDPEMRKYLFTHLEECNQDKYLHSPLNGELFAQETNIPLYLAVGDHDAGIHAQYFVGMQNRMANPISEINIIKDGTHAVFKTQAELFNRLIDAWLAKLKF